MKQNQSAIIFGIKLLFHQFSLTHSPTPWWTLNKQNKIHYKVNEKINTYECFQTLLGVMLQGENWVMVYLSTCNDEWVWVFFWKRCDSPSALTGTPSTQTLPPFSWTTQEWLCAMPAHHPVAYHDRSILASHSYQPVLELFRQPINDTHMIAIQLI